MSVPADQRRDRLLCLAAAAVLLGSSAGLAWLGAPREPVVALAVSAVAYAVAGLFARLWRLRSLLLFQFRVM